MPTVRTPTLEIAFEEHGSPTGRPVVLQHGFPDDARAYDDCVGPLASAGYRVIVPYLRGYGPTRFLGAETPRSGQQAALGADLRDLLDALGVERAVLGGYDWGGRGCCIVAALWPERVAGLVTCGGYNLQNIPQAHVPARAEGELRQWYQWYFNTQRGINGLTANRAEIARLLWTLWCPNYMFTDAQFAATAASFDNPDFVAVVIQSYRHRQRNAPGDPALEWIEEALAKQPAITVPAISLQGDASGTGQPDLTADRHAVHFTGRYERRVLPGVGHFIPREAPEAFVRAVIEVA
jgi:pimeloyl-ACP methyl ester carboxylesterase